MPTFRIKEAASLLGVSTDTLRRWANGGKVQSYQTAGGHRRFLRSSLEALTSTPRRTRYETGRLADAATTIVSDVHRRMQRTGYAGMPWQSRLSGERRSDFRRWGQRTFNLVIEYVAAGKRAERQLLLEEAEKMGALYGTEASAAGLTLAYFSGKIISNRVYAINASDPLILTFAALLITAITVLATTIPATRAASVEPMLALRNE